MDGSFRVHPGGNSIVSVVNAHKGRERQSTRWQWHDGRHDLKSLLSMLLMFSLQSLCLFAKSVQACPTLCDPRDWTVARQAPLFMGFSRQEFWSWLPCPPPGDLPNPGIEPESLLSPALAGGFCITSPTWEAASHYNDITYCNASRPKSIIYTNPPQKKNPPNFPVVSLVCYVVFRKFFMNWVVLTLKSYQFNKNEENSWGFPGGSVVKNLPANARDMDSIPGPGRSHMPWSM